MFDRKREVLALSVLLIIVVGLPAVVFGYEHVYQPAMERGVKVFTLTAQMPEGGGWQRQPAPVRHARRPGSSGGMRLLSPIVFSTC